MIISKEFVKFACNLKEYLNESLVFIDTDASYPVAKLKDITINFTHYKTEEEARDKWNERKNRINWNNLFIITNDRDNITLNDIN